MKCFTKSECRKWLASRGIIGEPYKHRIPMVGQFRISKSEAELVRIAHAITECLKGDREILLIADDWGLYRNDEMECLMQIRKEADETRRVIDAPGHEIKRELQDFR